MKTSNYQHTRMSVTKLQKIADSIGLIIKIQNRETLGFNFFRIVVAKQDKDIVKIWGEIKGWTFPSRDGLHLDTLRILDSSPPFVTELIWATTMSWALEKTSCRFAKLLAIYDDDGYSKKLVRYFRLKGFQVIKEVGSNVPDLFRRIIWGGAGTLMKGKCLVILEKIEKKFKISDLI